LFVGGSRVNHQIGKVVSIDVRRGFLGGILTKSLKAGFVPVCKKRQIA